MAEAAATAIGIISFGLTVCKGLYTYYHAYTGFDSNISSAHESIAQVARTLILLKDSCNDPNLDQERKDRVATCVCSCEDTLKSLNTKLQQLRIADPEGFREKAKARFKRHAYPFKEQSLKELRDNAIEAQRQLSFAVQILSLAERLESRRVLDYLETWSNGVTITIDQISDDTQRLLSIARSDEIDKIKAWLSPPDPWTNHHAARSLHQTGTGKWVLDGDVYKAWLGGSTRHLWLCGKAGCGKTILSSSIVEDVQRHCCQAVGFGLAPFYFTFTDRGKQSYEAMLRSLIAQLGLQEPGLPALQEKFGQRHKLKGELNVQSFESILLIILATYDTVFVVLDALDECPEEGNARSKLFDGLEYLANEAANLKILMTSRDIPDIRDCMVRFPAERLPIMTGAVDKDIHSYVAQQLSQGQYFRRLKRESLDLIQTTITRQADGMFRWAYCQLFELSQSKSTRPSRVENVLKTLPATLDETYARMLERIGPADRDDAFTLLQWLAYAMTPITLAELQTAVTIRPADDEVDDGDEGGLEDSLSILAGLVVFSDGVPAGNSLSDEDRDPGHHEPTVEAGSLTPNTYIRLAHFSVKEYLESTRICGSIASFFSMEPSICHRFLSQSCLTYITYYSQVHQEWPKLLICEQFPLLQYAADQWHKHSKLQSGDDVSREVTLLSCKKAKDDWLQICDSYYFKYQCSSEPRIWFAVYLHLPRVAEEFLKAGEDVNTVGLQSEPILVTAVLDQDQAMVELLLAHGVDVNVAAADGRHALWWAAYKGLPLAKLLVDHGADVNAVCDDGDTALSAACAGGHRHIVEFLLERGAQVDTVETLERTALIEALRGEQIEIAELLIAKGADVNRSTPHTSALCATIEFDRPDIVLMLIDAGADVNAGDGEALFRALLLGKKHVVPLLEAKGANKLTAEQLNDLLIQVCKRQDDSTLGAIGMLLDRGADPNAKEGGALLTALEYGQEASVTFLEAKGAKRLTPDQLNDVLVRVCYNRKSATETAIEMLLDRGADANAHDGGALLAALTCGLEPVVDLLEARGAKKPTLEQLNDALNEVLKRLSFGSGRTINFLIDRGADADKVAHLRL